MINVEVVPTEHYAKYPSAACVQMKNFQGELTLTKKIDIKTRLIEMYWLLRGPKKSLNNKLLLYKQIIRPIWNYGCQLWGCDKWVAYTVFNEQRIMSLEK